MAVIKLTVFVEKLANVLSLFDSIAVERAPADTGPFVQITTPVASAATITGTVQGPFTVNGKTLIVKIDNGADQTFTFVTADPISSDDLADLINDTITSATASGSTQYLKLTTSGTGTGSRIDIVGGTALADLGFTLDDWVTGTDAHVALSPSQEEYEYDDQNGEVSFYYRTRFYSSISGQFSTYSDPILGSVGYIVPGSELIIGKIDLAGIDGKPVAGRVILFGVRDQPLVASSFLIAANAYVVTDESGHAEINLIKGARVEVTVSGTAVTRVITVPDSGSDFNLVDAIAAADDSFQIQIPNIPTAVRRSL